MAGLSVTVCLPPSAAGDVPAALATALAPFDLNSDIPFRDRLMWDEWRISGGSDGRGFATAPGCRDDDPRLVHDMPRWDGTPRPSVPGTCAGGPRGLLDLGRPQASLERAIGASWDLWQELSARYRPAVPLASFVRRWESDERARSADPRGDDMFAAYREQPLIKAYLDHPHSLGYGYLDFPHPLEHPVIGFAGDRADYIRALYPPDGPRWWNRDVLTLDGWWHEPGPLPAALHATCDPAACPHTPPDIGVETEAYLALLPDDTILVRLHCHG